MEKPKLITLIGRSLLALISCTFFSSCSIIQKTSKQELNNGFYTQHIDNKKQKVYLDIVDDTICIHQTKIWNLQRIIDTTAVFRFFQKEMTYSLQFLLGR